MYVWPSDYPEACPPTEAIDLIGAAFRFINGSSPAARDFVSYYERHPYKVWGAQACMARGLSICRTLEDCRHLRSAVPALRKKRVAAANIAEPVGVVHPTPSNSCKGHCTWWLAPSAIDVEMLFNTVPMPLGANDA